tara:strand:+ start:360 stop:629 length:270 start_codon:yes stop_codon:yes gene_type:complete
MKIVSKSKCNIGIFFNGKRIVIPASPAVLELDDEQYKGFDKAVAPFIKRGKMKFLKAPAVSKEEQAKTDAEALAAAKALIAASEKKVTK